MANIVLLAGKMSRFMRSGADGTWCFGGLQVPGYRGKHVSVIPFYATGMPAQIVLENWNPGGGAVIHGFLIPEMYETTQGRKMATIVHVASFEVVRKVPKARAPEAPEADYRPPTDTPKVGPEKLPRTFRKKSPPEPEHEITFGED